MANYLQKLKSKSASVTRSLLSQTKHKDQVQWKSTPYEFQASKVTKSKDVKVLNRSLGDRKQVSSRLSKLKKLVTRCQPRDVSMVIDLVEAEVSCTPMRLVSHLF